MTVSVQSCDCTFPSEISVGLKRVFHLTLILNKRSLRLYQGEDGLIFEDEMSLVKLVDAETLAELFELFADQVECVVLNACYSKVQARAIAQHINHVIGMSKAIQDKSAIQFAVGFYDGLGSGKSYEFAYKLGCSLIRTAGIPENLTPQLLGKNYLEDTPPPIPEPVCQQKSQPTLISSLQTR